ncbi:MAG: DUF2723 domain-containing protein [Bacteroidales bacterium]|nr:DUF2723 domain-containing protein [Bacteroidales bacterium]
MNNFKTYNRILGWLVFLIAAATYIVTAEPTVSLWDCGEFISSAYKLQVGHPPGAPFFMLVARFFTLFAGNDVTKVAFMVNVMSALASAFTIMFLYWTITHLALKITGNKKLEPWQLIAVLASGLVGSLAYTFSDTFWFSAVEGEVYASSSFFTAIVFWAILKWENIADEKYSNRWLIFIAYLMGLSIGVHLLNLLAIPAIVLVYYFKKYETTRNGVILALLAGAGILGAVMYILIPGVIWLASIFELLFVNSFNFPMNGGVLVYIVLLFAGLSWALYATYKKSQTVLNTALAIVTVIVIGYSSYAAIVIRSLANPPMDENSPETIFKLQSYLNREQYGDRPLVTGHYFNAPVKSFKDGKKYYTLVGDKYEVTNRKTEYIYDPQYNGLLPRMWSSEDQHVNAYLQWGNIKEKDLYHPRRDEKGSLVTDQTGKVLYDRGNPKNKPNMFHNMRYFFTYQLNHMYLRYFWWNFVGRQNDEQGHGGILYGNWISGIKFIDQFKEGDGQNMPPEIKNHPSRNVYYGLPFVLGIIGLIYHFSRYKKDAWVVLMLFVLTGIAIVVYLNQYPYQPRERDYAYAGSFYAYAIWIGLGVLAIIDMAGRFMKNVPASVATSVLCLLLVPGIMAKENWDDHDRSGRYTARDIAHNYLMSCAPNAILFTNGDNDTFPLWYAQEVEGIRTDVRIVNLMLLNMDWYADQMKLKAYESDPLPISLAHEKYRDGTRDIVFVQEQTQQPFPAKQILDFIASDHPGSKVATQANKKFDYTPTRSFILPVDSAKVIENGTVKAKDAHLIEKQLIGRFSGRLTKSDLIAFDIIVSNNWERPIYFVSTGHSGLLGLDNYLQLEGLAYRLVPIRSEMRFDRSRIDADILYTKLMDEFKWGKMNEDDVYLDNFHLRTLNVIRMRMRFSQLANALIQEGDNERAEKVLDRVVELTPHQKVPFDYFIIPVAEAYFRINKFDKANSLLNEYFEILERTTDYYLSMSAKYRRSIENDILTNLQIIHNIAQVAQRNNQSELAQKANKYVNENSTGLY